MHIFKVKKATIFVMKSKWGLQVKNWEESLAYSDPENIELNTLLDNVNFKGKEVLDVGCGIGRLALPLSKYAKHVVAVDIRKEVINYCNNKKARRNIRYILSDIRKLRSKQFDIVVFAQPDYVNFKHNLRKIHSLLKADGQLIIIRWIDRNNEYNTLLSPFWSKNKKLTKTVVDFSKQFMHSLRKEFKIKKQLLITTYESYPSPQKLFVNVMRDSPIEFSEKDKNKLRRLITTYNYRRIKLAMKLYMCQKS
mgnify:CR=1 FL=1